MKLATFALVGVVAAGVNPVTKVVNMLQDLQKKAEKEGKAEEKAWLKYKCWYESTTKSKKQSNTEAEARIESLNTFISDIETGAIEFTGERGERQKELNTIVQDLQNAKDAYEKQKKDDEATEKEMNQSLEALKKARAGIEKAASGSLLVTNYRLKKVAALGMAVLSASEREELSKGLQPETKDWKKLNRDATFKAKYEKSTGGISAIIAKMQKTFKKNLNALEVRMERNDKSYKDLKEAKTDEKTAAQKALLDLSRENGTKATRKADAEGERDDLTDQVKDDTKLMGEMDTAFEAKEKNYKERLAARGDEMVGISKAIEILYSDDARDMMTSSYESQGYFFTQFSMKAELKTQVYSVLKDSVKENKLNKIISSLFSTGSSMKTAIDAIDKMIKKHAKHEKKDLAQKESCEKDLHKLMKDTRKNSEESDDALASKVRNEATIKDCEEKIKAGEDKITALKAALKEADENLKEEKKEYEAAKSDDQTAKQLVGKAKAALKKADKSGSKGKAPNASKADKDAPEVSGGAYTGTAGLGSVISTLEMIEEDIQKDVDNATTAMKHSEKEFDDFKKDTDKDVQGQEDMINKKKELSSNTKDDLDENVGTIKTKKEMVDSLISEIASKRAGGCDFISVNIELLKKNRNLEVDGLKKAKAILQGAD